MYHIRKNARYRKMESIFAIKKKLTLLAKSVHFEDSFEMGDFKVKKK